MDALVRGRRLLLTAAFAAAAPMAFVIACAPAGSRGAPVGVSTAGRPKGLAGGSDAGLSRDAGLPRDKVGFSKVNATRFVSAGHAAGRFDVDVYVSDDAKAAYTASNGEMPVGARLIKEHYERVPAVDGGSRGPTMMMEKMPKGFNPEHGNWRYVVVTSSGEVAADGRMESCAGCHDDAPHDRVFRVEPR